MENGFLFGSDFGPIYTDRAGAGQPASSHADNVDLLIFNRSHNILELIGFICFAPFGCYTFDLYPWLQVPTLLKLEDVNEGPFPWADKLPVTEIPLPVRVGVILKLE